MLASSPEVGMATVKVTVAMQKQILELHFKGYSARRISKTLRVGRNTIKRVIGRGDVVSSGAAMPAWAKRLSTGHGCVLRSHKEFSSTF